MLQKERSSSRILKMFQERRTKNNGLDNPCNDTNSTNSKGSDSMKYGFIGAGNMAGAIIKGMTVGGGGFDGSDIYVYNLSLIHI